MLLTSPGLVNPPLPSRTKRMVKRGVAARKWRQVWRKPTKCIILTPNQKTLPRSILAGNEGGIEAIPRLILFLEG